MVLQEQKPTHNTWGIYVPYACQQAVGQLARDEHQKTKMGKCVTYSHVNSSSQLQICNILIGFTFILLVS